MGVTQQEIARLTGFSRSTVATILSGKLAANYNDDTRKQVLEMARRLNYRPNRQAVILKTGRSGIVGIVHTGSVLPLTHQKISCVVRAAREAGLEPLVYHNSWFDDAKGIIDALLANKVQGVVFINNFYENRQQELERLLDTTPTVQFGGIKAPGVPLVGPDRASALEEIAHHLVRKGHTHIIMTSSGMPDCATINPTGRFREIFSRPELSHIRHEIITINGEEGDLSDVYAPGTRALEQIKARMNGPVAVIASNDHWAIGLYLQCLTEGIRVPEDLTVTGADNIVLGRRLPVPLTTVEQPVDEMARRSIALIASGSIDPERTELFACRLLVRGS